MLGMKNYSRDYIDACPALTEADFVRLSEAFFAEIEKKYLSD